MEDGPLFPISQTGQQAESSIGLCHRDCLGFTETQTFNLTPENLNLLRVRQGCRVCISSNFPITQPENTWPVCTEGQACTAPAERASTESRWGHRSLTDLAPYLWNPSLECSQLAMFGLGSRHPTPPTPPIPPSGWFSFSGLCAGHSPCCMPPVTVRTQLDL